MPFFRPESRRHSNLGVYFALVPPPPSFEGPHAALNRGEGGITNAASYWPPEAPSRPIG